MSNLRKFREAQLISKAELARKAGVSTMTIDRIERGFECRLATKRKILEALGVGVDNRKSIFPIEVEEEEAEAH